jgi:DNA-damage-inducible protein D
MQSGAIQLLKNHFDALSQRTPDEDIEFWFARDIMEPLGYARWENFQTAIKRAIESCKTTGYAADDHFRGVTKMVKLGSSAERAIDLHAQPASQATSC